MQHMMLSFLPNSPNMVYYPSNGFQSVFPIQEPYYFITFNHSFTPYFFDQAEKFCEVTQIPIDCTSRQLTSSPTIQDRTHSNQLPQIQNLSRKDFASKELQKNKSLKLNLKRLKMSQYRQQDQSKEAKDRFIKKNTESNVVNQIFSFLWTPKKSKFFLSKILIYQDKIQRFYRFMKIIKLNCKSQINRFYLRSLAKQNELQKIMSKLKQKGKKVDEITTLQIVQSIKKLAFLYLRSVSRYSIMTSKKMNPKLWKMHFRKCDEIVNFLFEQS